MQFRNYSVKKFTKHLNFNSILVFLFSYLFVLFLDKQPKLYQNQTKNTLYKVHPQVNTIIFFHQILTSIHLSHSPLLNMIADHISHLHQFSPSPKLSTMKGTNMRLFCRLGFKPDMFPKSSRSFLNICPHNRNRSSTKIRCVIFTLGWKIKSARFVPN